MPKLQPRYLIDGIAWMPISHAAREMATTTSGIRKLMADGTLDWCPMKPGSTTFLVEAATVLRLAVERRTAARLERHDPKPPAKAKPRRTLKYSYSPPPSVEGRHPVAGPTWEPDGGRRSTLPPLATRKRP